MSFLSAIQAGAGWFLGGSTGAILARTAVTGYALSRMAKSVNAGNNLPAGSDTQQQIDPGVRLQIPANTDNKVPVVYGEAHLGGIITDVRQPTRDVMFYCLTICEKTGVKLSDNLASSFVMRDIYWNDQRVVFKTSGTTKSGLPAAGVVVDYTVDRNGRVDYSLSGLVEIRCYGGSSNTPISVENYPNTNNLNAVNFMAVAGWSVQNFMTDLVFAVVRMEYSKDKNLTQLGDVKFHLRNSMTLPGDCLNDYLTNTRYGAGISSTEILQNG
jgi:hypothetical protein